LRLKRRKTKKDEKRQNLPRTCRKASQFGLNFVKVPELTAFFLLAAQSDSTPPQNGQT
jgi:hypothetical protein